MRAALIVLIVLVLGLTGSNIYYWNSDRDNHKTVQKLTLRVNTMTQALEEVEASTARDVAKMKVTYDSLLSGLQKEIERGQVKVKQVDTKLSVSILDKVLFPSGSAEIGEDGEKILNRVGKIMKNTKGKLIRVEGHTDNVKIHSKLKKTYASNWELSTARASSAVRYLDLTVGIPGKRLRAIGMGPYHPVAKNNTAEGRKWNRRVEIALIPDPDYVVK